MELLTAIENKAPLSTIKDLVAKSVDFPNSTLKLFTLVDFLSYNEMYCDAEGIIVGVRNHYDVAYQYLVFEKEHGLASTLLGWEFDVIYTPIRCGAQETFFEWYEYWCNKK